MIKYEELDAQFLIDIVPEYENEIVMEEQFLEEFLPHCIFGNVLNPKVVERLKREGYLEDELLKRIFLMYEDFAVQGDEETRNLLEVTLLEILWDEKKTYERAMEMMGSGTRKIWDHIHEYLRIPTD
ncbi:MAG: hypothetical protein K2O32_16545 [Acetatifactor sp.]|nr:hypothetical protein [Acetatifactor sp.]